MKMQNSRVLAGVTIWGSRLAITATAITTTLSALAFARTAHATTITVSVTGGPKSGQCSLTDAIQAASTNKKVNNCPAGSTTATDTIQLKANTTYQGYGKYLNIPTTGGAVVIAGGGGPLGGSVIMSPDYGPSPAPINNSCVNDSAIVTGGTLTLKNLTLLSNVNNTTGICQYQGSLTLDGTYVGTSGIGNSFGAGGISAYPYPYSPNHRTINIINGSGIDGNYSRYVGAGLAVWGSASVTITNSYLSGNTSDYYGGAIWWSEDSGASALTITGATFLSNSAADSGGAIYLDANDAASTVTLSNSTLQLNTTENGTGGAIYIDPFNVAPVVISQTSFYDNLAIDDHQQNSLNSDPITYSVTSCKNNSSLDSIGGSEWPHTPPLKGDGTCTFSVQ